MKINQLIKYLSKFPADMEVVFYNGLVRDVQPISRTLVIEETVRYSKEYFELGYKMDWYNAHGGIAAVNKEIPPTELAEINRKAERDYLAKTNEYQAISPHYEEESMSHWYDKEKKQRLLVQAKRAGKTYVDRLGKIEY